MLREYPDGRRALISQDYWLQPHAELDPAYMLFLLIIAQRWLTNKFKLTYDFDRYDNVIIHVEDAKKANAEVKEGEELPEVWAVEKWDVTALHLPHCGGRLTLMSIRKESVLEE